MSLTELELFRPFETPTLSWCTHTGVFTYSTWLALFSGVFGCDWHLLDQPCSLATLSPRNCFYVLHDKCNRCLERVQRQSATFTLCINIISKRHGHSKKWLLCATNMQQQKYFEWNILTYLPNSQNVDTDHISKMFISFVVWRYPLLQYNICSNQRQSIFMVLFRHSQHLVTVSERWWWFRLKVTKHVNMLCLVLFKSLLAFSAFNQDLFLNLKP